MKISMDKNVIEFYPENDAETTQLLALWNVMVDCAKFNKKMTPIGEFVPSKNKLARFLVEGDVDVNTPVYAPSDMTVYCQTCNKFYRVKQGEQIPLCCGKTMESLD